MSHITTVNMTGDVSDGGDMELCGVDTVLSGADSGGLCELNRVSGVDTVVSGADTDRVSRGIVMSVDDNMSLPGGGDAVVSGVDEFVCGVNSALSAGVLNLCGVDTVVSGVDEPVCGVNSVTTSSELDMFGCDSVVSDEAGNSSGVEVVVSIDDVVACGDDPLLLDAVRVGGCLSVVGDTLMCGAGVALSDRGDTEVVFGPRVVQPGWADGLICAHDSMRHQRCM